MSGLFAYSVAGLGLLVIGFAGSLAPFLPLPLPFLSFRSLSAAALAALALLNSLLSTLDALRPPPRRDPVGLALQLDSAAVAALFLLHALASAAATSRRFRLRLPLPPSLLDLLCLFAFAAEFLLFALQRKDSAGVENRYYDLLLVPVAVCAAATALCAAGPGAPFPRLARGMGLALQGTWFLQMGFSFFSSAIAHGCALHQRSRGNFTIKCKGHPEYHRGRAIATLQFDGHLALLVVATLGVYAAVIARGDHGLPGERYQKYKPLSEMQRFDHLSPSHFTLDSDDDDDDGAVVREHGREKVEITAESQQLRLVPVSGVNGSTH